MTEIPGQLAIRVIPRARRNEVGGLRDGRLVVRTVAAPVEGRANDAVCRQVAEHFGIHPRLVSMVSGHRSRDKLLHLDVSGGGR